MVAFIAATVSEIFLGTTVAALGTKVAVDSIRKDASESYHKSKLEEISDKKAKAKEDEAKAKVRKEEEDAQTLAIHLIRNQKAFGGLGSVFKMFTKES